VQPKAEFVHWLFATGFLAIGLFLLAEAIVGEAVWRRRSWRAYLVPSAMFLTGVLLWPVMVLFTNSTIHMLAHGSWAQVMMLAGACELALVRGKLHSPHWRLTTALAALVSGAAFLIHEQNGWFFARSAFLHHAIGWTLVAATVVGVVRAAGRPSAAARASFALVWVVIAVFLYADRDVAPVFGHLSPKAGVAHR